MMSGGGFDAQTTRCETVRGLLPETKVFQRYLLKRVLGEGGMGLVFLAFDEKLERNVALKFLPDAVHRDPEALAQLKEETKRNLELTHPHIVRIYDLAEDARAAAIAMEHVDGHTLSELRLARPHRIISAEELWPWLVQMAGALDYAHLKKRVAHRDLKPSNLMVSKGSELKIADFGIARTICDSLTRITGPGQISGTLPYMSPQQLTGQPARACDDIYSLGATLFDLLTGKPPFYTGDLTCQIRSVTPPEIARRRQELGVQAAPVPAQWEKTIAACLAKEPGQRPQTAGEVMHRLGPPTDLAITTTKAIAGDATAILPRAESKPAKQTDRRLWASILAAGGILTLLAAATMAWKAHLIGRSPPGPAAASSLNSNVFPRPGFGWTNSLGQVFVPLPGEEVLFCIWKTRVRDFEVFVAETSYNATDKVASMYTNGWQLRGETWRTLGQASGPNHPVCGLSWEDAQLFCQWLTAREQRLKLIAPNQTYRLPSDQEWTSVAGTDDFTWGNAWPPPPNSGNFCGEEQDANWLRGYPKIAGYRDGYARTSPVASFPANRLGIYDLAGNVYEYCDGWYRKEMNSDIVRRIQPSLNEDGGGQKYRFLRGSSWADFNPATITAGHRERTPPEPRFDNRGFRCVLLLKPAGPS